MSPEEASRRVEELIAEGYLTPGYVDPDGCWEPNPERSLGLVDAYKPDDRLRDAIGD